MQNKKSGGCRFIILPRFIFKEKKALLPYLTSLTFAALPERLRM